MLDEKPTTNVAFTTKPIQIGFNVELLLSLYIVPLGLLQLKSARVHYCK